MLHDNYASFPDDERRSYIKIIRESSKNVFKLLENLLTWAKSQRGDNKVEYETIDVKEMLAEVIQMMKETAENKEVKLKMAEIDGKLSINSDKNMIDTVLRNLISNAVKLTPKDGEVIVAAESAEKNLKISVTDTGVGMSPEQTETVF